MTSQQDGSRRGVWSDLDLNGDTPVRVRPDVGDWGPTLLPSTREKQRVRRWVPVLATVILAVLVAVGWVFYLQVR